MATITKATDRNGAAIYKVSASNGRGRRVKRSWRPEPTWSKKTVERELQRFAAQLENELASGEISTAAEKAEQARLEALEQAKIKTLQQYAEQVFIPQKRVTLATKTVDTYVWTLEKYIFPALGNFPIEEITSAQITALLLKYQAGGKAHASVVRMYALFGVIFKTAFLDGTIQQNPMDKVARPKPRKDELRKDGVETLSEVEVVRLLNCMKKEPLQWRVYVSLLLECGLRRGEACGLQWKDFDFQHGTISISRSLGYTSQHGVYVSTPKSGHARTVYLSPSLASLLQKHRASQQLSKWVFTREDSPEPIHPDSPTRYLKNLGKRYGFQNLHPHLLRHTFASIAITNGADVVSISEILGHADTAITLRVYSHATEESRRRASQVFLDAIAK